MITISYLINIQLFFNLSPLGINNNKNLNRLIKINLHYNMYLRMEFSNFTYVIFTNFYLTSKLLK